MREAHDGDRPDVAKRAEVLPPLLSNIRARPRRRII
jgi:hypothetical protein